MGGIFILLFSIIVFIFVVVVVSKNKDEDRGCDFDCEHCPFPKCSEKEIEYMKNKYKKKDN